MKMQRFKDSRFGSSATLRYEEGHMYPYVLRCRDYNGSLYFKRHYPSAALAKADLEKIPTPGCCQYSEWWTVSGKVFDPNP